jgi:hypothetical protein
MKVLATALIAISVSFAGFDAIAQEPHCESVNNRDAFQTMVVAHLAAFVNNANGGTPPEVTLEIERTIYDVPSDQAVAAIDDAYNAYNQLCDRGNAKDAEGLFQQTVKRIVTIAGYRDEQSGP